MISLASGQEHIPPNYQLVTKKLLQTNMRTILFPVKKYDAIIKKLAKLEDRFKVHNDNVSKGYMTQEQVDEMKKDHLLTESLRSQINELLIQYPKDKDLIYRLWRKPDKIKIVTPENYAGL